MKSVTMMWAKENVNSINLIDVRSPAEFNVKNIEGSKNIPIANLIKNSEMFLNKNDIYYLMCHSGGRSSRAISEIEGKGYNLINVDGGISAL